MPDDDVKRRFYRSKNLFWTKYRLLADEWAIYYNSNDDFEEIANNLFGTIDEKKMDEFLGDTP